MKNKFVKIETIFGENILCVILNENKLYYICKSAYGIFHLPKEDIETISIIGDFQYNDWIRIRKY